jgi:heme exporter protein B
VLVIFMFAFESSGLDKSLIGPGELWAAYSFAAILGLNRSLAIELDNDCLQGLLLAPLGRGALYLGKVASNFTFMIIAEFIVLPVFFILNNLSFDQRFFGIVGISIIGTMGMAAVGTILSTISANTRMKEVMLPILQIPLTVPVVIAAVEATSQILNSEKPEISAWLTILAGFSIVYLTVSYLVFEFAVEE